MMTNKPWWTITTVLRLLVDVIAAEVTRARPGLLGVRQALALLTEAPLHSDSPQLEQALERLDLDSLEFLNLVTAIVVLFHLHETGLDQRLMTSRRLRVWVDTVLESRRHWDEAMSFFTSGSTGQPKLCTHPLAWLEEEISFFANELHDRRQVLSAVPFQHIYGFLFATMLPAQLKIPVHDVRNALPSNVLRRAQAGDVIVGHPAFFDLALRSPLTLAPDVTVISSTGHCPASVWQRLAAAGCARCIEVYGSSETAGIGLREAAGDPLQLLPHWSRPADTVEHLSRYLPNGAVVTTALPDQLQWVEARQFQVLGRRDGAVQVGGVNVFPQRVQECLCQHPDVIDATVRLASAAAGGRLKAFVVPRVIGADSAQFAEHLHHWLSERLTAAELPRTITIGAELPRSSLGKLIDWI
ncbi:AMP-binding protein [Chromatium okenii]|jgi:4-coumarate--CoA ligase (photoactive yellow protein activation family)|uniref:4-coumarate--CoA ligase n=1 Tax=Chromatium okenii TaxID=61644 RepID=A0A2S7XQS1_9GAMM|nr:AMP-binding protein [Chromatium okenii]MBV5308838.1 AMP-binding protein [Chromatium okenii]PQJ95782.1 4-coumarate--CoA ligase [Chromatium okenii]PQJ97621.1 4-coumarate--CoA ligase [Chromatium okenii]